MGKKTLALLLFILLISTVKCTQKIYDTPEEQVSTGPLNVTFNVSGAMTAGSEVTFTPVISGGAGGNYKLDWDWNGDNYVDESNIYPRVNTLKHEYSVSGTYTVILRVKDSVGNELLISKQIVIHEAPQPLICDVYWIGCPMTNMELTFNPSATGGTGNYKYSFDFNNDGIYEIENYVYDADNLPKHTYLISGNFKVKMTVNDGVNNFDAIKDINIESHTAYSVVYQRSYTEVLETDPVTGNPIRTKVHNEIYKMYQDGSNKHKITDGICPHITYNGTNIVYSKEIIIGGAKVYRLHLINKNGGIPVQISNDNPVQDPNPLKRIYYVDTDPKFSINNTQVAFTRRELVVTIPNKFSYNEFFYNILQKYFLAVPKIIDYYENGDTTKPIYILNADGKFLRDIAFEKVFTSPTTAEYIIRSSLTEAQRDKVISLLWELNKIGLEYAPQYDLWVMNADGSGKTKIASNAIQPAWKPDGSTIAFTRDNNIYTVSYGGGGESLFLNNASWPSYSPDGKSIAYAKKEIGHEGAETSSIYFSRLFDLNLKILLMTGYDFISCIRFKDNEKFIIYSVGNINDNNDVSYIEFSSIPTGAFISKISEYDNTKKFYPNYVRN